MFVPDTEKLCGAEALPLHFVNAGKEPVVEIVGVFIVKLPLLLLAPPAVVTEIAPVVAPVGTVAVILVGLFTVNEVAEIPLNLTVDALEKLVPVIATDVPTEPDVGVNEVIVGTGIVAVLYHTEASLF